MAFAGRSRAASAASFVPCLLLLLLCGRFTARAQDEPAREVPQDVACQERVSQLEGEFRRVERALTEATSEKDKQAAYVSTLESSLKEAERLSKESKEACRSKEEELDHKISKLLADLEAQAKQQKQEASARAKAEEQADELSQKAQTLSQALALAESSTEKKTKVLEALQKELLPSSHQLKGVDDSVFGKALLDKIHETRKHEQELLSQVQQLRGEVLRLEHGVKEGQQCASQTSKLEKEKQRLEGVVASLRVQLTEHQSEFQQVAAQWLPPWMVEGLKSTQKKVEEQWTQTAAPTIKLVHSKSLDAFESARRATETHLVVFLQSSRDLASRTRDTMRPHVELALQRHQVAMEWLGQQASKAQEAAEPHVKSALVVVNKQAEQLRDLGAPYLQYLLDAIMPYYQEVYLAVQPAMGRAWLEAKGQWQALQDWLSPHLDSLAKKTAQYQRHAVDYAVNVSQHVTGGAEGTSELLLFGEFALYILGLLGLLSVPLYFLGWLLGWDKESNVKSGSQVKSKAGSHVKKHHQNHKRQSHGGHHK